jgi:Protein of unknown function (DUF2934)
MPDREHRVREVAHRLWEEEGRPFDQDKRHWAAAERIVDAEASASPASTARPASKRPAPRRTAKRTTAGSTAGVTSH